MSFTSIKISLCDLTESCLEVTVGQSDFGKEENKIQSASSQIGLNAADTSLTHSLNSLSPKRLYTVGDGYKWILTFSFLPKSFLDNFMLLNFIGATFLLDGNHSHAFDMQDGFVRPNLENFRRNKAAATWFQI